MTGAGGIVRGDHFAAMGLYEQSREVFGLFWEEICDRCIHGRRLPSDIESDNGNDPAPLWGVVCFVIED